MFSLLRQLDRVVHSHPTTKRIHAARLDSFRCSAVPGSATLLVACSISFHCRTNHFCPRLCIEEEVKQAAKRACAKEDDVEGPPNDAGGH